MASGRGMPDLSQMMQLMKGSGGPQDLSQVMGAMGNLLAPGRGNEALNKALETLGTPANPNGAPDFQAAADQLEKAFGGPHHSGATLGHDGLKAYDGVTVQAGERFGPQHLIAAMRQVEHNPELFEKTQNMIKVLSTEAEDKKRDEEEAEKLCKEGDAALKRGDAPWAKKVFKAAAKVAPIGALRARAFLSLASALERQGREHFLETVEALQCALAHSPGSVDARFRLANILKSLGRPLEACEQWQMVIDGSTLRWATREEAGRAKSELEAAGKAYAPSAWTWQCRRHAFPVERLQNPSAIVFEEYLLAHRPCLIAGAISSWPALSKWSLASLKKSLGDHKFRVMTADNGASGWVESPCRVSFMTYAEFVDRARIFFQKAKTPVGEAGCSPLAAICNTSGSRDVLERKYAVEVLRRSACGLRACHTCLRRVQWAQSRRRPRFQWGTPEVNNCSSPEMSASNVSSSAKSTPKQWKDKRAAKLASLVGYTPIICTDETHYLYGDQTPFKVCPALKADVHPAPAFVVPFLKRQEPFTLWLSTPRCITPSHYDLREGLLAQVRGRKLLLLAPPEEWPKMYPKAHCMPAMYPEERHATVDVWQPDMKKFPLYKECESMEVHLNAGEIIYIPNRWWHSVVSLHCTNGGCGPEADSLSSNELMSISVGIGLECDTRDTTLNTMDTMHNTMAGATAAQARPSAGIWQELSRH